MCVCTVLGNSKKRLAAEFAIGVVACFIVVNILSVKSVKFSGVL